jgi:methionyl-tRNA formyltransferase
MKDSSCRIALFVNHLPGLQVASFLAKQSPNDTVVALYLTGENEVFEKEIIDSLEISSNRIFVGPDTILKESHLAWLKMQEIDAIICVYWPWLLKEEVFSLAKITVNFHPALLPINRGWYPHVHSLIDGSKAGVTLHQIKEGADTGDIWIQKEVNAYPTDTAKELYERLQVEIVALFENSWANIKNGVLVPVPQDSALAVYHSKNEIESLDYIDLNKKYNGKDLLNKLKARSFGSRGFAFYEVNGEKIYIKIALSIDGRFKN